jgi:hypothetical protein
VVRCSRRIRAVRRLCRSVLEPAADDGLFGARVGGTETGAPRTPTNGPVIIAPSDDAVACVSPPSYPAPLVNPRRATRVQHLPIVRPSNWARGWAGRTRNARRGGAPDTLDHRRRDRNDGGAEPAVLRTTAPGDASADRSPQWTSEVGRSVSETGTHHHTPVTSEARDHGKVPGPRLSPEREGSAKDERRGTPRSRGRDQRPAGRCGGQPVQALSYGTKAENTLVRSAKSTPPLSTGLAAVEPWVEIQNGSKDAPIEGRPS